nr:hypothetical protein [Pirellulales bacterium]
MPYAETTAGSSLPARMDWKSALVGGGIVMVMAYVGLVAPAWRQVSALEREVAKLASAVAALTSTGSDVDRGTSLLTKLEAQSARLTDAEAMLERFETIGDRILAQADRLDGAAATLARFDDLHERIDGSAGAIDASADAIAAVNAALGAIDEVGTRAVATRDAARESTAALAAVDAVHEQLKAGLATLDTAAMAAGRLAGLSERLAGADGPSAEAAERLDALL